MWWPFETLLEYAEPDGTGALCTIPDLHCRLMTPIEVGSRILSFPCPTTSKAFHRFLSAALLDPMRKGASRSCLDLLDHRSKSPWPQLDVLGALKQKGVHHALDVLVLKHLYWDNSGRVALDTDPVHASSREAELQCCPLLRDQARRELGIHEKFSATKLVH